MSGSLLEQVTAALDGVGARYALAGAGALAVHGVARSTFDLDLFTTDAAALEPATWARLGADSRVQIEVCRGDADDPLAGVVRLATAGERDIDVVVGRWRRSKRSSTPRGSCASTDLRSSVSTQWRNSSRGSMATIA
ncbi:MAG: hypothetical protein NTV05_18285 [Acidobacteria bacterium]|nr:hypothetical protein [Acidobacteriota bacterium]